MAVIKHYTPSLCWLAPQQDSQRLVSLHLLDSLL